MSFSAVEGRDGAFQRFDHVPAGGGEAAKFLDICENGFALSADAVFVVESNANRWSEEDKKKPNRVMTATK